MKEGESTSWSDFVVSLIFMTGGLSILLALFAFLHFFEFFRRLLASRMYMNDKGAPPKPMDHAFAWVLPMLGATEEDVIQSCGLDAAVYLRMFRFSAEISFVMVAICCPVLLTINVVADDPSPVIGPAITTTDYLTISNVPKRSIFLWAHFTLLYVMSGFVIFWTAKVYRHVWALRHKYLAERSKVLNPEEYTVLVTDVPRPAEMPKESMVHVHVSRIKDGKQVQQQESDILAHHGNEQPGKSTEWIKEGQSSRGDCTLAEAAAEKEKETAACWSAFFWTEETQADDAGVDGRTHGAPEVFTFKIPKSWLRGLFAVLRVLTCGLVQPPKTTDATPEQAGTESAEVDTFFHRLYPGAYLHNQGIASYSHVQRAYKQWRHAVTMLDRVRFRYMKAREKNVERGFPRLEHSLVPYHRTGFLGCFGPRVESISFWIERVRICTKELKEEQENAAIRRRTGAAFVIFNSRRAASVAVQTSHAVHGTQWLTHLAPEPQDVRWASMGARFWERTVREEFGFIIFLVLVLFFYLPVSFTTLITSVSTLEKWVPGLTSANSNGFWYKLVETVVPPLGLRLCYWVAPDLLIFLSHMQGSHSNAHSQQLAATRFYYLLLFNVWFLYLLTGTVINAIPVLLNNPKYLLGTIAAAVPSASGFFMAFIMSSTLVMGTGLLRFPVQLPLYFFRMVTIGQDICDREKLWNQGGITYHVFFPYQSFILTLGLIYACIAPLVLPVVLIYSLVGYFISKHQVMYVYSYPYQTGGLLWLPFMRNVLSGLMIAQLTAMCIFALKQSFIVAGLVVPLPYITFYAMTLLNKTLNNTFKVLPMELTVEVDEYTERTGMAGAAEVIGKEYTPIAMRPVKNPNLDPHAGPAENIHELINPAFIPSQLKEALEGFAPLKPLTEDVSSLAEREARRRGISSSEGEANGTSRMPSTKFFSLPSGEPDSASQEPELPAEERK